MLTTRFVVDEMLGFPITSISQCVPRVYLPLRRYFQHGDIRVLVLLRLLGVLLHERRIHFPDILLQVSEDDSSQVRRLVISVVRLMPLRDQGQYYAWQASPQERDEIAVLKDADGAPAISISNTPCSDVNVHLTSSVYPFLSREYAARIQARFGNERKVVYISGRA